jgi:hypothetical protein
MTNPPRPLDAARQPMVATRLSARPTLDAIARPLTQPPVAPPAWASRPLDFLMAPPHVPVAHSGGDTIPVPVPTALTIGPVRRLSGMLAAVVRGALRDRDE